ncbi:MAG TPA: VanZ family protein [Clostridia bacterium]|nr:VanZ family protein [Clostridia bacterium]
MERLEKGHGRSLFIQVLLWLLVFAMICAIYMLSGQEGAASQRLSKAFFKGAGAYTGLREVIRHYGAELDLSGNFLFRKIAHFVLFFILASTLYIAVKNSVKKHEIVLTAAGCTLLAGMDEYHQIFVSGREARIFDVVIDFSGTLCALLVIKAITVIFRVIVRSKGGIL